MSVPSCLLTIKVRSYRRRGQVGQAIEQPCRHLGVVRHGKSLAALSGCGECAHIVTPEKLVSLNGCEKVSARTRFTERRWCKAWPEKRT